MAHRFMKKLGTQQLRYQFDLSLHEIQMSIPYTVSVCVVLKKDQKRTESKKNPLIGGKGPNGSSVNKASFDGETLSMISTVSRDK